MTDNYLKAIAMICIASALATYLLALLQIIIDILRDPATGGLKKTAWLLGLLVLPGLAALAYVLSHGSRISKRKRRDMPASRNAIDSEIFVHVRPVSARSGPEQIRDAQALLESGAIDKEEFSKLKAQVFAA